MISRLCYLMHVCFTASILLFISGTPVAAQEWTTINKDYSSQRYVDLDQITPQNVGGLKESCEFQLNEASWFSSGLLMVDRTLYVNTMRATYAIDAATCALRWRTVLKFSVPANINNRGPAYLDGTIFRGTVDGRVVALDPLSMAWESAPRVVLSSSALCATFKDKAKNGNRDLAALEHHVATDPFVLWAWSPGSRPNGNGRLTPPITHEELVQTMKEWEADDASCPTQ